MALNQPELSFTLTPDELDRVLRYGLEQIGLSALATSIAMLDLDLLTVFASTDSDLTTIKVAYWKRDQ